MAFTSVQKIRFDDVDGAGIVYYPKFLHLCHKAFEDFFDTVAPVSYPALIRDRKQGFPAVAIKGDFTAPLSYGDVAIVEILLENVGNTSVTFDYRIRRKRDGVRCFQALITTVLMDLETQKPIPIPKDLLDILERILGA